ncbi:MAG: transcription initiation factor TFIIE alpha subunit [Amphiamblys sp. WSBS2006]|nr:MAG: transcription initiation factor TFIIE alpha subunit [Amphiamblys sp. WSBS2006]
MGTVENLVCLVGRMFYEDKFVVALEILLQDRVVTEDTLGDKMDITQKEASGILTRLRQDRLVRSVSRIEKTSDERRFCYRIYFYVDRSDVVDLIKYKIFLLRREIEEKGRQELSRTGYVCTLCGCRYGELDLKTLFAGDRRMFLCETCGGELAQSAVEKEKEENEQEHQEFMAEAAPILECLKELDERVIQETDIDAEIARMGDEKAVEEDPAEESVPDETLTEYLSEKDQEPAENEEDYGQYYEQFYCGDGD